MSDAKGGKVDEFNYTYTIIDEETGQYYYGKHSTNNMDDGYMGSGAWVKEVVDKPSIKKVINEFFKTPEEAYDAERLLVSDLWKTDPKCMNRMKGGKTSFFEKETYSNHCMVVWGVEHHMKSEEFLKGFTFPFKDDRVQRKVDQTLRTFYGSRGSGSHTIKKRVETTNLSRYGETHTLDTDIVKEAREAACLEKYGSVNPFNNPEKLGEVLLERYGFTNMMYDEGVKKKHKEAMSKIDWRVRDEKRDATCLTKYGTTDLLNRPEVRERHKRVCPYGCVSKRGLNYFDVGNFSQHMMKIHNWSTYEIKQFKEEHKENPNKRFEERDEG